MAKTDWQMGDTVLPDDLNQIGQEINDVTEGLVTHKTASVLDHPDGSVTTAKLANGAVTSSKLANGAATDSVIGNRTISDSSTPTSDSGALTTILGWLANMIKAITGKSSWRTAPATSLEAAKAHMDATTGVHGATSAATPNTIVQRGADGSTEISRLTLKDYFPVINMIDTDEDYYVRILNENGSLFIQRMRKSDNQWMNDIAIVPLTGKIWTSQNHGAGSGLDADMVDGYQSSQLVRSKNHHQVFVRWEGDHSLHIDVDDSQDLAVQKAIDSNKLAGMQPTNAPTPNSIVQRDSQGRIKAAAPSASDDVARKAEVDAVQNSLSGHIGSGGSAHAVATTSQAGFMSAADKSKLNGIEAGAQVNTVTSVAGKTGAVTLSKSDVGLGSVQNYGIASQAQAQAGTDNASYMTPLRTKQAIDQFVPIETGNWTPELRFGGSTAGIAYTFRGGQYTRIANVVYWTFEIMLSSKGSASGTAIITGLPFNKGTGLSFYHNVSRTRNMTIPSGQWVTSNISSSTIYLSTNTGSIIMDTAFANDSTITASGFYFI